MSEFKKYAVCWFTGSICWLVLAVLWSLRGVPGMACFSIATSIATAVVGTSLWRTKSRGV